ncbi:hypothetical protein C5167_020385 [Papaver somniferum]|uniref:MULE transposase domain-containing protein n=1 Tax=Papaver somniferum TaxID=3469 RepID=A0A4Y7ISV5_PAPSO|nr:hypothetical protein C5167_020385 [Papaver somniferum]
MRYVKDHTCGAGYRESKVCVPAKFVKQVINEQVRNYPLISPKKIISDFKTDYEINLPYQQAYNGIKLVHKDMYGDDVKAYTDLVWYVKNVEETNEGSIVDFQYDDSTQEFKRLFIAYGALIKGFKYCRAMLYLDATFLTGRFKGCLMAATAKNGNDEFYPIAYGIVSHEDGANWVWFLENLKKVVKGRQIVFLSDQGTGLLFAVPKVFPDAYHSYCYYQMKQKIPVHGDDQLYPHVLNHWRHAVYALTEGRPKTERFQPKSVKMKNDKMRKLQEAIESQQPNLPV